MFSLIKKNRKKTEKKEDFNLENQNLNPLVIKEEKKEKLKKETSLIGDLKKSLNKTSFKINQGLNNIFANKKPDDELLEDLEDLLISSDIGIKAASSIIKDLSKNKFNKQITAEEVKIFLSEKIEKILLPSEQQIKNTEEKKPYVILFCGVNGSGKTTSIGKYSKIFADKKKKVLIAACDTFRVAANEQLNVWAKRSKAEIIFGDEGSDPASVAYRAIEKAKSENFDILLIDTAGRLQNKKGLMDQLIKISKVIKKIDSSAPHDSIIVLDATTGQNSCTQVRMFNEAIGISGIVINKLDGSAKGGVVVSIAEEFKLPVYSIGVGESLEDIKDFNAKSFAKNLFGIN